MKSLIQSIAFLILIMIISISCKKEEKVKLPTIETLSITNITDTSATSGGNITEDNGTTIITRGVCWSTSITPIITNNKTINGAGAGSFTSNINGLIGGATYYVRAYATNSTGTGYGMAMSFTTLGQTPSPTVEAATNINTTSSTLNGSVNANYLSTVVTFEYGTTTSYGITVTASQSPVIGNTISNVSADITGLTAGTIYHYRIKATNSLGTTNSNDITFTTSTTATIVTDFDGNVYNTVTIGTQVWMKENLKTTHYSNGTAIPLVNTNSTWYALTASDKAYCWYNDDIANKSTYGALYTWAAAMNGAATTTANPSGILGVCPTGWHLPSDAEWTQMENYLADNGHNYDGTTGGGGAKIGKSLASTSGWVSSTTTGDIGNIDYPAYRNKSGFTALPGGYRGGVGAGFGNIGRYGYWRSATDDFAANAWYRSMGYDYSGVGRGHFSKENGYSVRCLRD